MEPVLDPRIALRNWRKADAVEQREKLSQEQAAKILDCSVEMLGGIERGIRCPGRRLANRIKAHVGIPTEAWDKLDDDGDGTTASEVSR